MVIEPYKLKLLNLGCGKHYHPDWTNIDFVSTGSGVIGHNLLNGIPFPDESFDVVYHSHVLEHFSKPDGHQFIMECYRVLKNGGMIRIAVPDLEGIAREYLNNLEKVLAEDSTSNNADYDWSIIELFDQMVRKTSGGEMAAYWMQDKIINEPYVAQRMGMEFRLFRQSLTKTMSTNNSIAYNKKFTLVNVKNQILKVIFRKQYKALAEQKEMLNLGCFRSGGEIHQWMYDRHSLKKLLEQTGFMQPSLKTAFSSAIPGWSSYGLDTIDGEVRKPDSLFIEAKK